MPLQSTGQPDRSEAHMRKGCRKLDTTRLSGHKSRVVQNGPSGEQKGHHAPVRET
jgi:hypothetical protein